MSLDGELANWRTHGLTSFLAARLSRSRSCLPSSGGKQFVSTQ